MTWKALAGRPILTSKYRFVNEIARYVRTDW